MFCWDGFVLCLIAGAFVVLGDASAVEEVEGEEHNAHEFRL